MTQSRSVLTIDKELNQFLSLFDQIHESCALFDADRTILYKNLRFIEAFGAHVDLTEHLNVRFPELNAQLVTFFEKSNLYDSYIDGGVEVMCRRIVNAESEFALVTFTDLVEIRSNGALSNGKLNAATNSALFKSVIENAPDAILILDFEQKKYVDANPKALKLFGYPKKLLLQTHVGDLSPNQLDDGRDSRIVSTHKIQQCIDTGKSIKFNWIVKRMNGELVPCEIRVHRLPTASGIFIRSSITDLSDKLQARTEIKSRKAQFKTLFGSENLSMVMCNLEGSILESNRAFSKMLGFNSKAIKDLTLETFIHPNDIEIHQNRFKDLKIGKKVDGTEELRFIHADGNVVTGLCSAKQYTSWNGSKFIVETIKDVSKEKKAISDLEASERKYRSLFEHSTIAIMLLDATNKKILSANPMALQILGYNKSELFKKGLDVFDKCEVASKQDDGLSNFVTKIINDEYPVLQLGIINGRNEHIVLRGGGYKLYGDSGDTIVLGFTDTTESEKRKAKYVSQRNQLSAFVEYNMIPVAMFDDKMNYLLVGRKWLEMYPTKFGRDIIGRNYYEIHPKVPQRWRLTHMKAMGGETIQNVRDMHVRSNGKREWFKWLAKPWYVKDDKIGGIIVYAEIITEEVEAENKAKNQEARFKSFFENSTLGWIEVEADSLVEYCRKTSKKSFSQRQAFQHYKECKVLGFNDQVKDIFAFYELEASDFEPNKYVKSNARSFAQKLVQCLRDHVELFEHEIVIQNEIGEERTLFVSVRLPEAEDFGTIVYGILDVTDLKVSISALRDSEERYRTMFEGNSLGVVYTNYKKSVIRVNKAFTNMFGYSEQEMAGINENDLLYPKFKKQNREIEEGFRTGRLRQVNIDKEYKRKNGSKLIASTSSSALYDDSGAHYGSVTIINDITDRKLGERRIQKQNDELRKINRELDQFVYSAAHDLRAPIANVLGLVKLLKLEEMSPTAHQYVDLQEKSLDKLDVFIKSIVDYSRNSRLELAKNEIELKGYLEEIAQQYAYYDNADKLKVTIEVKQNATFVTDASRLSIVMNNLVSNAVRYLDVGKKKSYLNIQATSTKSSVKIVVEDNGIGIESEHLGSIFDLFYRANAESKGTGIGLYIVKEAVDKLKGNIYVKSVFGKGTKFTVVIKNLAKSSK